MVAAKDTNGDLNESEGHLSILLPKSDERSSISTRLMLIEEGRTHFHLHTKGNIKRVTRVTVRSPDLRAFGEMKEGRSEGQLRS